MHGPVGAERRRWPGIAVPLALLLLGLPLLWTLKTDHSARVFLDADDPAVRLRDEVEERFGIQRFVILLQEGPPLTEERLAALAGLSEALALVPGVSRVVHALDRLPARLDLLERLEQQSPLAQVVHLSRAAEGAYAWLVLVDATRREDRRRTLEGIERAAATHGPPGARFSLAGLDVLDREMERSMDEVPRVLIPLLVAAMAVLLWSLYRDLASVAAILLCVGAAELAAMEVFAAFGQPMNLLTILLPVLQLSLTTALSLHVVTHVRVAGLAGRPRGEAIRHARRSQWRPCFWTAFTTSVGFGSLATSDILPLRVLGLSMAASILIALGLGFTLLPALLDLLRARPREGLQPGAWLARWVPPLVLRRRRWVAGTAAAVLTAGALAVPGLRTETNGLHYLAPGQALRRDTEEVQRRVTGTTSLDLVARRSPGLSEEEALEALHQALDGLPGTRGVLSLRTLAGQELFRARLAGTLAPDVGALQAGAARFRQGDELRVTLLMDTVGTARYRPVRAALDRVLQDLREDGRWERVAVAGDFPIIMQVQDDLLQTLGRSLGLSFGAILLLVLGIHRRPSWTLVLAPVLLLPLAAAALACRLADVPLTIGTVMVFSVTLGIAVDDAIHVLHAAARGQPLVPMLREVGEALCATSLAIGAGFLVLGGSPFLPTRHFGLVTALAMLVALAANLVVLPGGLQAVALLRARRAAAPLQEEGDRLP